MRKKAILHTIIILILGLCCLAATAHARTVTTTQITFQGPNVPASMTVTTSDIVFDLAIFWEVFDHVNLSQTPLIDIDPEMTLPPVISVTKPAQGETLYLGDKCHIHWTSERLEGRVKVFLARSGLGLKGLYRHSLTPEAGVENSGYWRRDLKDVRPGEYRILVQSMENSSVWNYGEPFQLSTKMDAGTRRKALAPVKTLRKGVAEMAPRKVYQPGSAPPGQLRTIQLTSSRGMETWYIGDSRTIEWKATGVTERVKIVLLKKVEDGVEKVANLSPQMGFSADRGSFNWKIGRNIKPGSQYAIRIETLNGDVKSQMSGGFNIRMKVNEDTLRNRPDPKFTQPPSGKILERPELELKDPHKGGTIDL